MDDAVLLEKMRTVLERRYNDLQIGQFNIYIDDIKYAGKMELSEKDKDGNTKLVEKDIFIIIERYGDDSIALRYYDEDQTLLGTIDASYSNDFILPSDIQFNGSQQERYIRKEKLKKLDKDGKNLEDLTEENKENEENKNKFIESGLKRNNEEQAQNLEITSYRQIIDPAFEEQYPETCKGSKEKGIAYSKKQNAFVVVADYGKGFEIARNTEISHATMQTATHVCREKDKIEEKSPHAFIEITGNNNGDRKTGIAVEYGQYGYIRLNQQERVNGQDISQDLRQEGESRNKEKDAQERIYNAAQGINRTILETDLLAGNENQLFSQIVDKVVEQNEEKLDNLVGSNKDEKIMYVKRALRKIIESKNIVATKGDTVEGILIEKLSNDIETDEGHLHTHVFE